MPQWVEELTFIVPERGAAAFIQFDPSWRQAQRHDTETLGTRPGEAERDRDGENQIPRGASELGDAERSRAAGVDHKQRWLGARMICGS